MPYVVNKQNIELYTKCPKFLYVKEKWEMEKEKELSKILMYLNKIKDYFYSYFVHFFIFHKC